MEILEWVVEKGGELVPEVCAAAAERGLLNVVQWTLKKGCKWVCLFLCPSFLFPYSIIFSFQSKQACYKAARGGHKDMLQWAHDNDYLFLMTRVQGLRGQDT